MTIIHHDEEETSDFPIWSLGYKTFFMLSSAELEILTAYKKKLK